MQPPLLALAGLAKSVPGPRLLFERLGLTAAAGEIVAIMGESGVGKSTLLNLVAGLDLPDAGSVAIGGTALGALDEDARTRLRRERIGFVFQAFHVLPHLSLVRNVALPLLLLHVPSAEARGRATAMLQAVGLGGREQDFPRALSGGELQRVAIARALVHSPALILADEPTGNLDPETAARILALFAAQVRGAGAAALLVTHSEVAAAIADRTLTLTRDGLVPPAVSAAAIRWMIGGEWRAHPARVALAAAAIAIGVALGFAVHLVNASALTAFDAALRTVTGDADLRVEAAGPAGFDERLYPRLARIEGIAAASPVVLLKATAGGRRIDLLGLDLLRAGAVTPGLLGRPADPAAPPTPLFDDNALFLSAAALAASGRRPGDAIELVAGGRRARFRVVGTLPAVPAEQAVGMIDIAAAQWRFGRLGLLDRVDLKLADGADPGRVRAGIAALLPPAATLATPQSDAASSDALSRAYRVNLDMLALVALLTGAFLVYSAQSLSVTRRAPQFALLRVLGAARAMPVRQLVAEGAIVGAVGAGAGLALGLGLAVGALGLLGGDLGGGYFAGTTARLAFAPGAAFTFLALGMAAALAGSAVPAMALARAQPAVALRNAGDASDPARRPALYPALLLAAAGIVAAGLPPLWGLPLLGYLAIGLLLAAGIAAMPWLARALLAPLAARDFAWAPGELAVRRLWGAPGQATVALSGIVASTSLMIAMAVMVVSFRGSVEQWLGDVLSADVYLRIEGGGIDPDAQRRAAAVPGIARIAFNRLLPLRLAPDRPPVMLIARADPAQVLPMLGRVAAPPPGTTAVYLSEPAARIFGYRSGDAVRLPLALRTPARFVVAGIWRDYARQHGAIAIDARDYARLTGDRTRDEAAATLAPGASPARVTAALHAALPAPLAAQATLAAPRQLRRVALRLFDRSFAVTYLLEAIAILVGLAGVAATFSAQTIARAREFGMLRHVGVTKPQIVAMLASEGALTGAVGVAAGIALGTAMSQVLIRVVNPQSFHWTMETHIPWGLFAGVAAALVTAAAGTAMLAGRRALAFDAVRAAREDM